MRIRSLFLALPLFASSVLMAQRLPSTVHPEHYTLHMTPDLAAATFRGEETIDVLLDAASNEITLNANELEIVTAKVTTADGTSSDASVTYDTPKQQATFHFARAVPAGKAALHVQFNGILNDKLRGFYLSKTAKRSYAVTQFESTDARRAFPCFDEPAMKATFDVSLTVAKSDTVIANGPQISDVPAAGEKHTLTFGTTPKMSTYLVAFQVGDFACSKGKSDGIPIRVCSTPDKVKLTKLALDSAKHFLHYYDTYFGIKYPMAKLDMVALPDFEAGAMENFGCITYRETDLLVDAKGAPLPSRKRVAIVVAHEMSHQWFGDLVTMQWWDNLWLNEGFATWMESKAVNDWQPQWSIADDDAQVLNATLDLDSQPTTHPILQHADAPAEIEEMFDGISYGKGGAVIGMVEHSVGEETFRRGVHNYLAAHAYANATAQDFWSAQTATSGQPVDKIMSSFVVDPGAPILRFGATHDGRVNVSQSRLLFTNPKKLTTDQTWTIPVCLRGAPCQLLTPESTSLAVPASGLSFANADFRGFYRTDFAPADVERIIAGAPSLSPAERIGLLGDRWSLVRAGQGSVSSYLDLAIALRSDTDGSVLDQALNNMTYLLNRVADDAERAKLLTAIKKNFAPVYASLPKMKKHEDDNLHERRARLLGVLGAADEPVVVAQAKDLSERFFRHDDSIDRLMATQAIYVTAMHGSPVFYEQVLNWSKTAEDPGNRVAAINTLAAFTEPALVTRTLDLAVSGQIRSQDSYFIFVSLLARPSTRLQTWKYMQENWPKVNATLTVFAGQRVVGAAGNFCSVEDAERVQRFFASHPVAASERSLQTALNSIRSCALLKRQQTADLDHWLARQ